ncbi:MAG: PilN domain-containing protein [Elusimicrobia bacterium]|nr:PilN domain-containing protein [Elusimicrobiota bacterium]
MIKVNLVPADILAKAAQKQQMFQLGVVGVGVLLVVAMVSVGHFTKAVRLEADQKGLETEYAKWQEEVRLIEDLQRQVAELRRRLDVVNSLLKGRPLYAKFMTDVVKTIPGGVWVKSMSTSSTMSTVKMIAQAESSSPEEIREWVRRMEGSGRFGPVEIGAVTSADVLPKTFAFSMTTTYTAEF